MDCSQHVQLCVNEWERAGQLVRLIFSFVNYPHKRLDVICKMGPCHATIPSG